MSAFQFLLLEANLTDAEVVQATLIEGGINCELLRVETRAAFIRALESNAIDLILADYALSNFDEMAALTIARRLRPEIPFIFISGSLGEELAIAAIKQGATDYVLKQRLGRLVPSVQRALQEVPELDKDTTKRKQALSAIESDLKDTQLLHELSARLVTEGDIQTLYQEIIAAAIALTRADAGTVQIIDEATQELVLLATQGFERNMTEYFYRVNASSNTPCGIALKNGARMFVDFDVPESEDPDGSMRIHVDAGYLSAQSTPLIARSGKLIGIVSTHWRKHHRPSDRELRFLDLLVRQAADLIEQRQGEAALRESEARMQLITNLVPDLLWDSEPNGFTNWYNQQWLEYTGQTFEQAIGWGWVDTIHLDDREGSAQRYREATEQGVRLRHEHRIRRYDGEYRWFVVNAFPLKDESGKVIKMYGAATDIHEARVAMEALRESEAKYRSLFQSMDQGYAVVEVLADDNGEWNDFLFLEVNPAFEQQTAVSNAVGRKATEILGTPNPAWAKIYGRVAQTGEPVRVEEKEKTLDRVFDLYAFRLGEAESRCVAVLFTDITERVGVEDERKQHDANLDFLAEVSQDLARLTDIDETMNALGEKIGRHFGLSACAFAELYGSAGIAVIDYNWHRSDVPSLRGTYRMQEFLTPEVMQLCLAGVDIVIRDVFDDPLTDGEQFATLNIGSFLSIPLIRNGEWQFLLVIYRSEPHDWRDDEIELTRELANRIWTRLERARAEVGLRQSEEKYRLLFNSINEGYALCELLYDDDERAIDWKILQVNPAFESLTGLRDVAGKNATQLNQPLNQNWLQTFGTVAQTGESARFEHYIDSVDCWFDILVSRIDEDKYHIVVVFNNITDRKQAQADQIRLIQEQAALQQERQRAESLAELDRAKTLFFSNVSHEFRTPLTLILAPLQDALSDSVNPLTSSQQEQLELAHRNSLRLLKLVNTLLDFSRIEADRLKANYEPTDLSTYTAELASVFRSAIENANLQLVVDCPPLPDPIYVDREMWEKIVLNLLSNALKFTFEGIISVSLKSKANTVELIVSDTGVGIAASELPHLFERFYQVKGAKGRSYEGSGIGLSLVQELVKRHGGAIAVTSAVDQGTTFTVTIPTGIAHLPADQIWVASTLVSSAVTANAFVEEALRWLPEESTEFQLQSLADFSRDLENPSPNLSPTRREALTSPPSLQGKGAGGLGFPLVFPHDVKTQQSSEVQAQSSEVQAQSSEVQAQSSEVQAQSSEVQAQSSEVQAQSSEVRAQSSKVQAQSSKVQAQSSEVQAQSSEVHAQSSKRARILLVDDNADMRGYLRRLLNQYYEVEAVNDGLAAMTAIRRGGDVIYDLVLADVMMPRMDGFELLRSLRASPNTQTIPIILLSARAGEKSRVEGLETGADDYLIKPFSARELLARVNANLQLAQLRREAVYREQVMQAVQTLNDRLEQQVKARTAQLEAINQELEAFSSSVSHDLRTPLRYISSFAERLQGKLNATLVDASSLQSLNIITKSALEAEKMVDDLLEFSRLGQTEIHLTTVNISQLVQQVREQLQPELIGRSLHWEIEPLATVEADPVLLRLVLQNLLSNAVKYTRNNTEAAIKIGRIEQEQEVIFFVRDNGAGFDMKYCDRLFSIFQRLHPQEEFSGTGVGLATVRRIVHRHGGRIWAEGAINQGATFYFSLPKHEAL